MIGKVQHNLKRYDIARLKRYIILIQNIRKTKTRLLKNKEDLVFNNMFF